MAASTAGDIVSIYNRLIMDDSEKSMAVAAIQSLVKVLADSDEKTVAGTLDLLKAQSNYLKSRVPNSISVRAGTDLFIQYIISSLRSDTTRNPDSIQQIREKILTTGNTFATNALNARQWIANTAVLTMNRRVEQTVLTHGSSRCVATALSHFADLGIPFKVIYVVEDFRKEENLAIVSRLRSKGVKVAAIPMDAAAYAIDQANIVFLGAEAVVKNGGIISRIGTRGVAVLAKQALKKVYVLAESYKLCDIFPLAQKNIPIKQNIIQFKSTDDEEPKEDKTKDTKEEKLPPGCVDPFTDNKFSVESAPPVDYTEPEFIEMILSDIGQMTTTMVCDMLLGIYSGLN